MKRMAKKLLPTPPLPLRMRFSRFMGGWICRFDVGDARPAPTRKSGDEMLAPFLEHLGDAAGRRHSLSRRRFLLRKPGSITGGVRERLGRITPLSRTLSLRCLFEYSTAESLDAALRNVNIGLGKKLFDASE